MLTGDYDFYLPSDLIAQKPAKSRDQSRLLLLNRDPAAVSHHEFREIIDFLHSGDVLVLNDTRVIPARLRAINAKTGGKFELLLLEEIATNDWWAMARPGKRASIGTELVLLALDGSKSSLGATVLNRNEEGHRLFRFSGCPNITDCLDQYGEVPLPPYIERPDLSAVQLDHERYQTVFAKTAGSVAAPTAGLHFTENLLQEIKSRGVEICFVTLHVGLGTFAPVKAETIAEHKMHEERFEISERTADIINEAKKQRRRIAAVGTTSLRVLESAARNSPSGSNTISPGAGRTKIFIYPPYDFKIVDALLTNFHLPRSTLLMLISAFAAPKQMEGRKIILSAYQEAVAQRYRFFSYGDAMFIQ